MPGQAPGQIHLPLRSELVDLMLECTRRERGSVTAIAEETPCVGGSLLQDSLDVLEFIVALDRVYGVSIRDADAGRVALSNLGTLARYVAEHRSR